MIFVLSDTGELLCLLAEQDVNNMRGGRTTKADGTSLQGKSFKSISICLNKTDADSVKMVQKYMGGIPDCENITKRGIMADEECCHGCQSVVDLGYLEEGLCIICWKEKGKLAENRGRY